MRIKVFEQVKNTYTFEAIGRSSRDHHIAINGWAFIVDPAGRVVSNGRSYEFNRDFDGCYRRIPLSELSPKWRRKISNIAVCWALQYRGRCEA